jgi:hypothetical protein
MNDSFLFGQEANSTKIIPAKLSEDLTHQDMILIKLTPSGTTAEADVSPRNIKVKVGTTVVWENMLPEKVYVQSKPDENHFEGELLNGTYFFPGESREEKLDKIGTFIYDGSNGFGSYYVRGTIKVVEEATQDRKIPVETMENQVANSATGNVSKKQEQQVPFDSESSESNETQSYSNSKLGLSLKHPTDWKVGSLKNGIQFIKEKNGVYVEIRKHNLESPDVQLKQYAGDDIKDRSSSREDFKLLNITETTISGNLPAYKAIYTFLKTENQNDFTTGGTTNKILRIWTFSQENAYHVAYVADKDKYDLYLPIAEKIIASIEYTPIQSNDNSEEEEGDSSDSEKKDNNSDSKDEDDDSKDEDDDSKDEDDDSKDEDDDSKDEDDDSKDEDDFEDTNGDGDIDCKDTDRRNFEVGPGDPGNLDGDGDGIGCEEG